MASLLEIFWSFCAVGVLTFGGGYAMLPIIKREIVGKRKWVDEAEVLDYYAIGQCLPGIIAVNTAVFIGHKKRGILGGIAAALGVVTPSVIIIIVIAMVLERFMGLAVVEHAFAGIRVAVAALIIATVMGLVRKNVQNAFEIALCFAVFLLVALVGISPVWIVLAVAPLGIYMGRKKRV